MKKMFTATAAVFFLTVHNPAAAQAQNSSLTEAKFGVKAKTDLGSKTEQELHKIMQEIGDAFLNGDKGVLDRYLAPDFTVMNAAGSAMTKAQVVSYVHAAPASLHQSYAYEDTKVQDYGNTAVLTTVLKQSLDRSGGRITTAERRTVVFIRQHGQWQVVAAHISLIPAEIAVAKVDPAVYDAYAGQYQLASDQFLTLTREGDKLVGRETQGGPSFEFLPRSETTFFMKGQQDQMTFVKDNNGQVTHISHRWADGQEVIEKK